MSAYRLTAARFDQILERDAQGRVVKLKKHRRGDVVTGLDEQEVIRLLSADAIEPIEDDADTQGGVVAEPASSVPETANPVAEPAHHTEQTTERPAQVAPKSVWVAYAVDQGMSPAEAEDLTKAELVARFAE